MEEDKVKQEEGSRELSYEDLKKKLDQVTGYNNALIQGNQSLTQEVQKFKAQIGYLQNQNGFKRLDYLFGIIQSKETFGEEITKMAIEEIRAALFQEEGKKNDA